jgi:hypothetical protein
VAALTRANRLKKPLETLILQGFCAFPMVAKRDVSGYNMSYFNPVLRDPAKYRQIPIFRSLKYGVQALARTHSRRPEMLGATSVYRRRRGNLKERFGGWCAGREASESSPF